MLFKLSTSENFVPFLVPVRNLGTGLVDETYNQVEIMQFLIAVARDGSPGGVIRLVTIDETGITEGMSTPSDPEPSLTSRLPCWEFL